MTQICLTLVLRSWCCSIFHFKTSIKLIKDKMNAIWKIYFAFTGFSTYFGSFSIQCLESCCQLYQNLLPQLCLYVQDSVVKYSCFWEQQQLKICRLIKFIYQIVFWNNHTKLLNEKLSYSPHIIIVTRKSERATIFIYAEIGFYWTAVGDCIRYLFSNPKKGNVLLDS